MVTKSKAAKVPATKINFANPEFAQLTANFKPAKSKIDGTSQLTYLGYEHSMSKDGENGFMKLVFSVMDETRKNPENIPVLVNYRLSDENKFGRILRAMGCELKAPEYDTEAEEDEYGLPVIEPDYSYVYEYLDEHAGYVYRALLTQQEDKPGLYRVDVDTIAPFLDKEGKQRKVAAVEA